MQNIRINQPLRKPKTVEGVPPFLSDGTPIFLYYYQSAQTNWIYLTMSTNLILGRYYKLSEINKADLILLWG